ncbi:hypothetical protein GSUET_12590 [Geobacter sulfurreducens subsp. ethanolicus]|uniref:hypothetical protein n=1 Tax=Geobacter sulfurreducens TaxID=35554 RepID=UPI0025734597|nr:hypothetical protein [Geobacter sulfurreducens]BEH09647.1 hypothetical protein GSUET_12590 [Geobacter sulfurreducens subsp. ethanolicus]
MSNTEEETTLPSNQDSVASQIKPGVLAGNIGKPILLTDVNLAGVSAHPARGGEQVQIWVRLALTSDDRIFHQIASDLANVIENHAQQAGKHIRINRAETVLLVIKADNSAELWVDTAAVAHKCMIKRSMKAGSIVFESDIADVTGMYFPRVDITRTDKVLCLFRQDWRFALYFDFNHDGCLDLDLFTTTLGSLYRNLRYRHLYDALANEEVFDKLLLSGWFPFVEIITSDFKELVSCIESGFELTDTETGLCSKFDEKRLTRMFDRWVQKPHFSAREPLLKAAVNAFLAQEPVAVIKIVLTEIEGIMNDAYKKAHGKGAKIKKLLEFAVSSAERKVGQPDTLFFTAAFAKYLTTYTFANFDPKKEDGTAGSRHAVGHGAARSDSYTMCRALQAILTLDQIAFYI